MRITKYKCLSCQKVWGGYNKKEYIFVSDEKDYVTLKRGRKNDNH